MHRRYFLLGTIALSLRSSCGRAAVPLAERSLEGPWRVPGSSVFELWPSRLGLDLAATLAAVDEWSIPFDSRLVLRIEDGEHPQGGTLNVQHPYGRRLSIIGNRSDPSRCRLLWQGTDDALYVGAGGVLGLIDGITLEHTAPRNRGLASAILADEGAVIRCGPLTQARGFYYGFQARIGGVISCRETESHGAGDANYFAFNGGHISANGAKAFGAEDKAQGLGSGFVAEYGGTINAQSAIARYNAFSGFTALSNGVIRAYASRAENNGRAGYYVGTGGTIVAHDAAARRNCGDGLSSVDRPTGISGNRIISENNNANPKTCARPPP